MEAISRAIGAISAIMLGMASAVIARKRSASWPCVVISSSWRSATAIHTTPVNDSEDEQERTGGLPKHVSAQDAHRVPPAPLAAPSTQGAPIRGLAIQWFSGVP